MRYWAFILALLGQAGLAQFGLPWLAMETKPNIPLLEAAAEADTGDIKELLEQGVDLEERDSRGNTALMWAAATGSFRNVVLLIRAGANVDAQNSSGCGAIMAAVSHSDCPHPGPARDSDPVAVILALLAAGANPDPVMVVVDNPGGGPYSMTPLMYCTREPLPCLELLLAAGADPNWRDLEGDTLLIDFLDPIHIPFPYTESKGVALPSPASKANSGFAFPWPSVWGNRLWLAGAPPPDPRISEVVWLLLQYGADPNAANLRQWTPLHAAAWNGNREAYQLLLEAGADIHALAEGDTTVLMAASYASGAPGGEFDEVVADLLAAGLSANAEDRRGATALMYAVEGALIYGERGGNLKIIETLLAGGSGENADPSRAADPNHQDHSGKTALIWVFDPPSFTLEGGGSLAVARLLLEHGADPYLQDKYGKNALDYGRDYELEKLVEELNP